MSQAQLIAISGRYSKRKRSQVNYYEGSSDVEEQPNSQDVVEYSAPKKRRAPRPLPKRRIFPFLSLPAEIRNIIYDYCLQDPNGIYLTATTKKYRRTVERVSEKDVPNSQRYRSVHSEASGEEAQPPAARSLVPSLLAVNKQIYNEGRDILYGNYFKLADPITMHSFLVDIGPRAAKWLKSVTLLSCGPWRGMQKGYNHSSFAMLAQATNLQKFRIDGAMSWGNSKWTARQVYRDGFPWLEAVGVEKGRLDAAIDLIEMADRNFDSGWRNRGSQTKTHEESMEEFRGELRKLLGARMKAIREKPGKKSKK